MEGLAQAELFFDRQPGLGALFAALAERIGREWPQTRLRTMKTCISFDGPKPFLYVSIARKAMTGGRPGLLLSIGLPVAMAHERFLQVVPVSANRYTVHMTVCDAREIDSELIGLIAMSREMMKR